MKAISLKQPWANLIAAGLKTIETRKWSTKYRGELLIVSSKSPALYPAGAIVAKIELVDVRRMKEEDQLAACCLIYENAHSWIFESMVPYLPVPQKGQLGLYDIDVDGLELRRAHSAFYKHSARYPGVLMPPLEG